MFLRRADHEAVLGFLADVSGLEFDTPYPREVVVRLGDLVPCADMAYQELDFDAGRTRAMVGIDGDDTADETADDDLYWSIGPCPISQYRITTGDLATVRMSDLIDRSQYHELPVYREYFAPFGIDHVMDLGLPVAPRRHRSFIFFRQAGEHDFTERDRAVLELLRPHLSALEATAALRRQLTDVLQASEGNPEPDVYRGLTAREREIVELVAEGKTNAQIAAQLWVAPSTVKKHLEHVYEKLGVGRRTAAATYARASR
ncbi:MAG TPA: LuxR C-terminal-related transcriptional regulator [Candidatus Sulfomarinibacteraceae bacterium]|nr:LuxR C-terminal-related transcriptional regulator [Candidatus Sulfomarinibacteraceae bacterium]